jgi:hypothetical protein
VRFQKLLECKDDDLKVTLTQNLLQWYSCVDTTSQIQRENIEDACETALHLLHTANPDHESSLNTKLLTSLFHSKQNSDVFLFSSGLYADAGGVNQFPAPTENGRQLSAKLHASYGTQKEALGRTRSRAAHPFARSKVYDLRRYTDENLWGPFQDDGSHRTDWEKVEAIMIVLGFNLQLFSERCSSSLPLVWDQPFEGIAPNSYVPVNMDGGWGEMELDDGVEEMLVNQPEPPLDALDPYGVSGIWRRVSACIVGSL